MSEHNYVDRNVNSLARAVGQKIKSQQEQIELLQRIANNALIADNESDGDHAGRLINDYYSNYNNINHNYNKKVFMQVKLGLLPSGYNADMTGSSGEAIDWCGFIAEYERGKTEARDRRIPPPPPEEGPPSEEEPLA